MKHVLIIWQDVPDRIRIYDYIVEDEESLWTLKRCHGNYINCSDNTVDIEAALDWLNRMLGADSQNPAQGNVTLLHDSEREESECVTPDQVDLVIVTGFLM